MKATNDGIDKIECLCSLICMFMIILVNRLIQSAASFDYRSFFTHWLLFYGLIDFFYKIKFLLAFY